MQMERLLRLDDVRNITTLSRSEIYRRIKEGSFPKQVRLSHRRAVWRQCEIQNWMERSLQGHL